MAMASSVTASSVLAGAEVGLKSGATGVAASAGAVVGDGGVGVGIAGMTTGGSTGAVGDSSENIFEPVGGGDAGGATGGGAGTIGGGAGVTVAILFCACRITIVTRPKTINAAMVKMIVAFSQAGILRGWLG